MNINYMVDYDATVKTLQRNISAVLHSYEADHNISQEFRNNIDLCLMIIQPLLKMLDNNGYHYTYAQSYTGYYMWQNLDDKTINSKSIKCLKRKIKLDNKSIDAVTKQIYNEFTGKIKNKETEVIALFLPIFYGSLSLMEVRYSWYSVYDIINLNEEQVKKEITKTNETNKVITSLYDYESSTGVGSSLRGAE